MPSWRDALPFAALGAAGLGLLLVPLGGRRFRIGGVSFASPLPGRKITSKWGASRSYRATADDPDPVHRGIDFAAPTGTPVLSSTDGVVEKVDLVNDSYAGLYVQVLSQGVRVRYLHLSKILVKLGQRVRIGDVIGLVGTTGVQRSGAHLHFDIHASKDFVAEISRKIGTPPGGFPSPRQIGTAVPAEWLIPA